MTNSNENEEVISLITGYPYNILPKGYPNKISDNKIEETVEKILNDLRGNASVETMVNKDTALINLGLNELNNRTNRRQSRIAFWLSVLSVILAGFSLLISSFK